MLVDPSHERHLPEVHSRRPAMMLLADEFFRSKPREFDPLRLLRSGMVMCHKSLKFVVFKTNWDSLEVSCCVAQIRIASEPTNPTDA
jgi:hypothetical protein